MCTQPKAVKYNPHARREGGVKKAFAPSFPLSQLYEFTYSKKSKEHGWVVWICTVQKFRAFAPAPRFRAFGAKARGFGQNFRAFASSAVLRFALLTVLGPRRAAPLTCRIKRRIHNRHVIFQPWAQEIVTKYRASKPFGRRLRSRAVPCGRHDRPRWGSTLG